MSAQLVNNVRFKDKKNIRRTVRVSTILFRFPTSVQPSPDCDPSRSPTLDAAEAGLGGLIEVSNANNSSSSVSR